MPTDAARARGWTAAFAAYGQPRVRAMLFLGFSAGLPFLLVFSTLSAWLTQADIARSTIGLLSWVGLAYSIKFFWAPVVDRLALPGLTRWLGRRRSWMLLAQAGLITGLSLIALGNPAENLSAIVWAALLVAFASATQDIAIDAWRIEAAAAELQGAMAAAYQLGYRIALLAAGAGALVMASRFDWHTAYLVMAALVGVGVLTTLLIAEPEAQVDRATLANEARVTAFLQRRAHWPEGLRNAGGWMIGAVVCPFLDFFTRNGLKTALVMLAFVGAFRLPDITMGVMANPFYLDIGYSLEQIAAVAKVYGVIMTIIGAALGGAAVFRLGLMPSLLVGGVLAMLTNLTFAGLALWPDPGVTGLTLVISAENLASGFAGSAFIAYLSSLTNTMYTATQYALFSSLFTLPGKLLAGGSGFVVEAAGYPVFFVYTALVGLPALLLLGWLRRLRKHAPAVTLAAPG